MADKVSCLFALQAGEAALLEDLAALKNPAPTDVTGQLEAYLNLKHDLEEVIAKVRLNDIHITHLVNVSSSR